MMDWFDLLTVQGTLKSLFQHRSSKASILWHSVFFIVQLSHPYMTTGKTIALTIQAFVVKVVSLLFKTLSRFDIAILPRSKYLLMTGIILNNTKLPTFNHFNFKKKKVQFNMSQTSRKHVA